MASQQKIPILIVDDRPENLSSLEALLGDDMELDVVKALSGNEALRHVLHADFALVLLDVQMPGMDGFETAELMRKNPKTSHLPIIFVTAGMREERHLFKGYDTGAVDYLMKPIEPTFLRSKVRVFCELFRQRRELEMHEQRLEALVAARTADLSATAERLAREQQRLHEQTMMLEQEIAKRQTAQVQLLEQAARLKEEVEEHRLAEEALTASEEKLRLVLDSTGEAIYGMDLQRRCTFCNAAFLKVLGYSHQEDLLGKDMHLEIHHSYQDGSPFPVEKCRIFQAIQQGLGAHVDDEVVWRRDGTCFAAEYWSYPQFKGGEVVGAVVTFIEITKRKLMEEQLIQSQKMESIGRLAGGVAHDFNNMLSVILGTAELLKLDIAEASPAGKYLDQIVKAAERSSAITRQLLAFSRKEIVSPRPVNLNELVTESKKMLSRLISEDIKLFFHPADNLWTVKIDPSQADQIVMNLSVNARDAMPQGGSLTIESANVRIDDDYSLYHIDARPGDYVQLTVCDTGIGMDRETLEHIFEPFFTTKKAGQGTGLGLSTVYGIVAQNKGFINVSSEPGHGTTFRIYLPRLVEEVVTEETAAPAAVPGSGTILLVEDEEMLLHVAKKLLEEIGYSVIPAAGPQQAISICERKDQLIDLILTDVVMPEMNGVEMVERIKVIRPDVRVLFMSGYTADFVAQRGIVEDWTQYIQKPLDTKELHEKISKALAKG